MEYIAFLRGINISGKNKVPMALLKTEFENLGFTEVSTYLNSGNVRFSSDSLDDYFLRVSIEAMMEKVFGFSVPVYVITKSELQGILNSSPDWWGSENKERYDNLIFILSDDSAEDISEIIGPVSEKLERVQVYGKVIFWTFERASYQKCRWWKRTASEGIAEKLTIRTAGTLKKIIACF